MARFVYPQPQDLEPEVPNVKAAGLLGLPGRSCPCSGRLCGFFSGLLSFPKIRSCSRNFGPDILFRRDGRQRHGIFTLPPPFRSVRNFHLDPAHALVAGVRSSCIPRRLLGCAHRRRSVGSRNGRSRIDHPSGGRDHGAASRRPSAFGLFTAAYGVFWFIGSAIMGMLYDISLPSVVVFCIVAELAAVPCSFWYVKK